MVWGEVETVGGNCHMSLESLLKPAKWVDEQVLRQYTKLTTRWEKKDRSRYLLSNLINIPTLILTFSDGTNNPITAYFQGMHLAQDNITKPYGSEFNASDSAIAKNSHPIVKLDRIVRMPLFLTGFGFTSFGLYSIIVGWYNNDNFFLSDGITNLNLGVPFLSVASCCYIKDADPKLLDKQPFWKTAYQWAKEKVQSLAPEPVPQPVPLQSSATLEDYV